MSKVKLIVKKEKKHLWHPKGWVTKGIMKSLPFYLSRRGVYFHRIRSADNYWRDGQLSHTSVGFWCGNTGFLGEKGRLYSEVPVDGILCATCEGRAIGAGLDGAPMINGKLVMYSPRDA